MHYRQSDSLSVPSSRAALTSGNIDADFSRLTEFHRNPSGLNWRSPHSITTTMTSPSNTLFKAENGQAGFETVWSGGWFVRLRPYFSLSLLQIRPLFSFSLKKVPNLVGSSVFTVYQPMRFRIRAYVPSLLDGIVQFVENGEDEESITKAWFNQGVQFSERVVSRFSPLLTTGLI